MSTDQDRRGSVPTAPTVPSDPVTGSVLGIDAAWTAGQPSGVALVAQRDDGWHCLRAAPSYGSFLQPGAVDWTTPFHTSPSIVQRVVEQASRLLGGHRPSVVAVDMPLALLPITGRRKADNEISKRFGAAWCGTHTPSSSRPGKLSDELRRGFKAEGYELATTTAEVGTPDLLLETYPHVALLDLLKADKRVPCKVTKTRRYWPREPLPERRKLLLEVQHQILDALGDHIKEIDIPLPDPAEPGTISGLKRFEDALDALVCAWVGIRYLERQASAFGDETAAIWVPQAAPFSPAPAEIT